MTDSSMVHTGQHKHFDPDHYRMTIGEHLEELRVRMILALIGFAVVAALCLFFGTQVMAAFCRPLFMSLIRHEINPQLYNLELGDGFMVWIEVSLISAAALSSPWIVYQFWQFIASGLYEHERKIVTKYVPLSITLLISGMLFVYFLVLPWTIEFFLTFSIAIPLPNMGTLRTVPAAEQTVQLPVYHGDPIEKKQGDLWINLDEGRLKVYIGDKARIIPFGPENLIAPMITLPKYIDLVFGMLLTFALSFQMPLVIVALVAVGIVERTALKGARRYVYFGLSILAAAITPGDVITASVALMVPLCALYELGIWLAREPRSSEESS